MLAFACCDFPETVLVNWVLPWIVWAADDTRQFRHVQGSWAHFKIKYMIFIYLLFHRCHQFITSQLKDYSLPGGGGGVGWGNSDLRWQGWSKDLFGFEIFDFGIFLGRKILLRIFSSSLIKLRIFGGIQNNLKILDSSRVILPWLK